jgi:hypothetical protein
MTTKDQPGIFDTTLQVLRIAGIALLAGSFVASYAYADDDDDDKKDDHHNDPSGLTPLVIDADGSALEGLPEANAGTFEGGDTGHTEDASANNVLQADDNVTMADLTCQPMVHPARYMALSHSASRCCVLRNLVLRS